MRLGLAAVLIALGVFLLLVPACSGDSPDAGPCEDLVRCCDSLATNNPTLGSQCRAGYDEYHGRDGADRACADALASLAATGVCEADQHHLDSGVPDGSSDRPQGGEHEACDAYLTCTSVTTPEGLGVIVATYGPNGTCWQTMPAETCVEACLTGLRHVRLVYPDELSCPTCFSDANCEGSADGVACDRSEGRCVPCISDSHCVGLQPACDTGTNTCVGCTRDEHCGGATPGCDLQTHACVTCTRDEHCGGATPGCSLQTHACVTCTRDEHCGGATPACNPGTHACVVCTGGAHCTSGICREYSCCEPGDCSLTLGGDYACGSSVELLCGTQIECGSCAKGTCDRIPMFGGRCSTIGSPCQPGGTACIDSEICGYNPQTNAYQCGQKEGASCSMGDPCPPTQYCNSSHAPSTCSRWCLTQADCPTTQTCDTYRKQCA